MTNSKTSEDNNSWEQKDSQYLWHPFTHLKFAEKPIVIKRTLGAYYFDQHDNKIIDAISSWWVNLHGHCNPYIAQKISEQLLLNEHSIFSGFTHPNAITLAERILKHLPSNQNKIFFSDDGSTAVEVAIKMALQFWHNKGIKKNKIIAFENAYHGDTFGGMSVGARNAFNAAFSDNLFEVIHIPVPTNEHDVLQIMHEHIKSENVAAFIFEPLVQGAAGMKMYDSKKLDELIFICNQNNVITIADEVMTGFGRTGKFFASDYLNHKPDIICLSKGLTGGFMPLGLTSCANFIYNAFIEDDKLKTFFHGHSYTGNPLACAAALASLDLMEKSVTWDKIEMISLSNEKFRAKMAGHKKINQIRSLGTILAIEVISDSKTEYLNPLSEKISEWFITKGILLRPLGNIIYLIPPYCISQEDIDYIYSSIETFIDES